MPPNGAKRVMGIYELTLTFDLANVQTGSPDEPFPPHEHGMRVFPSVVFSSQSYVCITLSPESCISVQFLEDLDRDLMYRLACIPYFLTFVLRIFVRLSSGFNV